MASPWHPDSVRLRFLLIAMLALVSACTGSTATETTTTAIATTPPPSIATTTTGVTTTVPPAVWDLLWLSDSIGSGGVARAYAALIEADLGVEVEVTDLWDPGLSLEHVLRIVQGENDGVFGTMEHAPVDVLEAIVEAEVIVVAGNSVGLNTADWNCEPNRAAGEPCGVTTDMCERETWSAYEEALGATFDTIFELRGGDPVILRTFTYYLPWGPLERWRECDRESVCTRCWGEWSAAINRVGETHGVPVADLLTAFSGENLDQEMPRDYIRDDVHPSASGVAAIAQVLADLGYGLVYPVP